MPIFQQSVPADLYEWLMKEQEKRKVDKVQEVVRQILCQAMKEAEKHG